MSTPPKLTILRGSTACRLARSGAVASARPGLHTRPTADALADLRADLDRLNSTDYSENERRQQAEASFKRCREALTRARLKGDAELQRVAEAGRRLQSAVRTYENSIGPVAMLRVQRMADALAKLPPDARRDDLLNAVERVDHARLVAHSLVDDAVHAQAGLGCLLDRRSFDVVDGAGAEAVEAVVAAAVALDGISELEKKPTPWAEEHRADARDMLGLAFRGCRSVAAPEDYVPTDLDAHVRRRLLPPESLPTKPVGDPQAGFGPAEEPETGGAA